MENELVIGTNKHVLDAKCNLVRFVQQTLNQYLWLQQLRKDIEILKQQQKVVALKLKETSKSVDQAKRAATTLEKKKVLRAKLYDLYKYNLGFEIKPLRGGLNEEQSEIMFSFHHINKSKPEEEYNFILVLNGEKYNVKLCTPQIKGIPELLVELNETNDLSAFVIQVRRNFCAIANT
ncbi:unnamed protein product [Larinioides sclopetarius]